MSQPEERFESAFEEFSRGVPLDEIVASNNGSGAELADLVALARELRTLNEIAPRPAWRSDLRRRLVDAPELRIVGDGSRDGRGALPPAAPRAARRLPVLRFVVAAAALLLLLGTATYWAERVSAGSVPGDALYGVKRSFEDVRFSLPATSEQKMMVALDQADRRVAEMKELAERGVMPPAALSEDYARAIDLAVGELAQSPTPRIVAERVEQRLADQERAIALLRRDGARLGSAIEAARNGQQRASRVGDRLPGRVLPDSRPPTGQGTAPTPPLPTITPGAPPSNPAMAPAATPELTAEQRTDPPTGASPGQPATSSAPETLPPAARPPADPPPAGRPPQGPPAPNPPRPEQPPVELPPVRNPETRPSETRPGQGPSNDPTPVRPAADRPPPIDDSGPGGGTPPFNFPTIPNPIDAAYPVRPPQNQPPDTSGPGGGDPRRGDPDRPDDPSRGNPGSGGGAPRTDPPRTDPGRDGGNPGPGGDSGGGSGRR